MYKKPVEYGHIKMVGTMDTTLAIAGTEYPLLGDFSTSMSSCKMFEPDSSGNLVYIGCDGKFLAVGTSDFSVSGASRVTYIMAVNGVNVGETPHDFDSPAKTQNISIADFVDLRYGDVISVKAKSDTDNIVVSPVTLSLPLLRINNL